MRRSVGCNVGEMFSYKHPFTVTIRSKKRRITVIFRVKVQAIIRMKTTMTLIMMMMKETIVYLSSLIARN